MKRHFWNVYIAFKWRLVCVIIHNNHSTAYNISSPYIYLLLLLPVCFCWKLRVLSLVKRGAIMCVCWTYFSNVIISFNNSWAEFVMNTSYDFPIWCAHSHVYSPFFFFHFVSAVQSKSQSNKRKEEETHTHTRIQIQTICMMCLWNTTSHDETRHTSQKTHNNCILFVFDALYMSVSIKKINFIENLATDANLRSY